MKMCFSEINWKMDGRSKNGSPLKMFRNEMKEHSNIPQNNTPISNRQIFNMLNIMTTNATSCGNCRGYE
jgi:hypothetical protein